MSGQWELSIQMLEVIVQVLRKETSCAVEAIDCLRPQRTTDSIRLIVRCIFQQHRCCAMALHQQARKRRLTRRSLIMPTVSFQFMDANVYICRTT